MKRYIPLFLLLAVGTIAEAAEKTTRKLYESSGKSYFSVPQMYQSATPEYVSFTGFQKADDGVGGCLDFTVFGAKSTNDKEMARYFTPFGTEKLRVDSFQHADENTDILCQHLGIVPSAHEFHKVVDVGVHHSTFGIGLCYKQDLGDTFFFEAGTPITRVATEVKLTEADGENHGATFAGARADMPQTVVDAFKQEAWEYGKIDGKKSQWGLADIELKVGWKYSKVEHPHSAESYFGILIPVGTSVDGKNLFQPVVGAGKHFGFTCGSNVILHIWEGSEADCNLFFRVNTNARYLLGKAQKRSFDVVGKPWARYMKVALAQDEDKPGINHFTKDVNVKPGFSFEGNAAMVYKNGGFHGELGFNVLARQAEKVELKTAWEENIVFLAHIENPAGFVAYSSAITINRPPGVVDAAYGVHAAVLDAGWDPIAVAGIAAAIGGAAGGVAVCGSYANEPKVKENQLDLNAAAHPAILKCGVNLDLGYSWDEKEYPTILGLGGGFEFSPGNEVLNRWSLWGKLGFSF